MNDDEKMNETLKSPVKTVILPGKKKKTESLLKTVCLFTYYMYTNQNKHLHSDDSIRLHFSFYPAKVAEDIT